MGNGAINQLERAELQGFPGLAVKNEFGGNFLFALSSHVSGATAMPANGDPGSGQIRRSVVSESNGILEAVAYIRARDPRRPRLAMILGSGLGALADSASDSVVIPGREIPGYPSAGVEGHRGDLVIGTIDGITTAFMRGRFHAYEGHSISTLTLPVRILAGLGATHLILSNAAGSLRTDMPEGTIMRITDHINLTGLNPLVGIRESISGRMGGPSFDPAWGRVADDIALGAGIQLKHGVYLWLLGPSYETPAEIRFFRSIGADAVGMSTVPEATAGRRLGLKVIGFSAITNMAAGLGHEYLSHDDVLEVGAALNGTLLRLVRALASTVKVAGEAD